MKFASFLFLIFESGYDNLSVGNFFHFSFDKVQHSLIASKSFTGLLTPHRSFLLKAEKGTPGHCGEREKRGLRSSIDPKEIASPTAGDNFSPSLLLTWFSQVVWGSERVKILWLDSDRYDSMMYQVCPPTLLDVQTMGNVAGDYGFGLVTAYKPQSCESTGYHW